MSAVFFPETPELYGIKIQIKLDFVHYEWALLHFVLWCIHTWTQPPTQTLLQSHTLHKRTHITRTTP